MAACFPDALFKERSTATVSINFWGTFLLHLVHSDFPISLAWSLCPQTFSCEPSSPNHSSFASVCWSLLTSPGSSSLALLCASHSYSLSSPSHSLPHCEHLSQLAHSISCFLMCVQAPFVKIAESCVFPSILHLLSLFSQPYGL